MIHKLNKYFQYKNIKSCIYQKKRDKKRKLPDVSMSNKEPERFQINDLKI